MLIEWLPLEGNVSLSSDSLCSDELESSHWVLLVLSDEESQFL